MAAVEQITLYKIALHATCTEIDHIRSTSLKLLPPALLADVLVTMVEHDKFDALLAEITNIVSLVRILKYAAEKRQQMIHCISQLMLKEKNAAEHLRVNYLKRTTKYLKQNRKEIENGMITGWFLSEQGWLSDSLQIMEVVFKIVDSLALVEPSYEHYILQLNCAQKLLHIQSTFCCFKDAAITTAKALSAIDELVKLTGSLQALPTALIANLYHQISVLHFLRSEYDISFDWSTKALNFLRKETPDLISCDVLRQAAKACVVKRKFQSANLLIRQAFSIAKAAFGEQHQKYSDTLLDYGFVLLNVDSITRCVNVYKEALSIRQRVFGSTNLNVAIAHEDLAYALYVLEYSSGRFEDAEDHIKTAIDIMAELVPDNHLMQASAKRVKALILEEIALDLMATNNGPDVIGTQMLQESEELHLSALQLSLEAFGEMNVQTAKHYGNLGRLYQSMNMFEKAEKMHQKAIKIKTDILGCYDYEVGLSIGHLASLYNYHMHKYRAAEQLYLQSIRINLKLFGPAYSGLDYDYRGLCHVYEQLEDITNLLKYSDISENWRVLRAENEEGRRLHNVELSEDCSMEDILKTFFEMNQDEEPSRPHLGRK